MCEVLKINILNSSPPFQSGLWAFSAYLKIILFCFLPHFSALVPNISWRVMAVLFYLTLSFHPSHVHKLLHYCLCSTETPKQFTVMAQSGDNTVSTRP